MSNNFEKYEEPNKFAEKAGFEPGLPGEVYGYQKFLVASDYLEAHPDDKKLIKKKHILKGLFNTAWFRDKSVLDLGANAGFLSIYSLLKGASEVTAVDMDKDYIDTLSEIKSLYNIENLEIINDNVQSIHKSYDLVYAFAMVHWLYSCTADYGSLDKVVEKLALLTNDILLIEWIEPNDEAIQFFKHIDFNPEIVTGEYTREAFEEALKTHFHAFKVGDFISESRVIYLCVKNPLIIEELNAENINFSFWEFFAELNENENQYTVLRNWELIQLNEDVYGDRTVDILCDTNTYKAIDEDFQNYKTESNQKYSCYKLPLDNDNTQFVNLKVIVFGSDYLSLTLQRSFMQSRTRHIGVFGLPATELFYYILYTTVFHEGAGDNKFHNVLPQLSEQTGNKFSTEMLSDLSNIYNLLGKEKLLPKDYKSQLNDDSIPYLYSPEYVISSRVLDSHSDIKYISRIYKTDDGIVKQTNSVLAEREYEFLTKFDSGYFPQVSNLETEESFSCFQIEFIEGKKLKEADFQSELNDNEYKELIKSLLTILDLLKKENIIHRDITPENIIVRDKKPVLIDFGWAKYIDEDFYTPPGLGAEYKSPEAEHCDVYSMGMIIKETDRDKRKFDKLIDAMTNSNNEERMKSNEELLKIYDSCLNESNNGSSDKFSIIIPCHNKLELTKQCIESIYQYTPVEQFELIVVDNASTDGTADYFKDLEFKYSNFTSLQNTTNTGFSKANNQGVQFAKYGFLMFLNNDTVVREDWYQGMLEEVKYEKQVAAVGALLLYPNSNLIQHCGVQLGTFQDKKIFYHIHQQRKLDYVPEAKECKYLNFITAACMLVKKSVFEELSGFDEEYINGFEDMDFCLKIKDAGYTIRYCGRSVVEHYESQTEGRDEFNDENYERLIRLWDHKLIPIENEQQSVINLMDMWLRGDLKKQEGNRELINELVKIATIRNSQEEIQEFKNMLSGQSEIPEQETITETEDTSTLEAIEVAPPIVSMIIPVFNNLEYTKKCLSNLEQNTSESYELIVVNNNSTDGSTEYLTNYEKDHSHVRIINNSENLGFGKACNQGADEANCDIIVFLNNDCEVESGWLENAINKFEHDEELGVLGAKLLYPDRTIQHCGIMFERTKRTYILWPQHVHRNESEDFEQANIEYEPHAVTGALLMIRKSIFEQVGGFDEDYPMYFEDTDLCFKAKAKGYKVLYSPDVVAVHHEGKTINNQEQINDLNIKSAQIFSLKWQAEINELLLETLTDKKEGNFTYLNKDFIPNFDDKQSIEQFAKFMLTQPDFYVHVGGVGDALLLLSTIIDIDKEITIFSLPGNLSTMENFYSSFPNIRVMFIPWENNYYTEVYFRGIFPKLGNCLGMGITPENWNNELEWNANLDITEKYAVNQAPDFVNQFKGEKLTEYQCVVAPKGSLQGMPPWKKNHISPEHWDSLLNFLTNQGLTPILLGVPEESDLYPANENCIDRRTYDFEEQMKIVANADICIAADSWHKTFSALCGVQTIVFRSERSKGYEEQQDSSEYVFISPWRTITLVRNLEEFVDVFNKVIINEIVQQQFFLPYTSFDSRFWEVDYEKTKTVLFKCTPAIGDALNLSSLIHDMKQNHPHLIISVSGNEFIEEIFRYNEDIDGIALTGSDAEFTIESISDKTIDYNNVIARLPEYYNKVPFMDIMANLAGYRMTDTSIHYTMEEEESQRAKELIASIAPNRKLVAVHLISSKDIMRSYIKRTAIITQLIENGYSVVNFGMEKLNLESEYYFDCGKDSLDLRTQIAIASMCDSFLTVDSAFFHLGHNYFDKPTMLIAGPTNPKLIGNQNKDFAVIRNERLGCLSCYWGKICKIECMNELSPSDVINKFLNYVNKNTGA